MSNKITNFWNRTQHYFRNKNDRFLCNISGVIHVGANIGQERDLYNSLGLNVLWIEPIPEIFEKLVINIRHFHKQKAIKALVTDEDNKDYIFNIANNSGASSSILELKHHKDIWPSVKFISTINLKSISLNSLLKRESINFDKYQALVIDTQGSELLVLQGSIPILKHFRYIKTEVPNFESYESCVTISEMDSFLKSFGYIEISRFKFAGRPGHGEYFDVVYKKLS